MFIEYNNKSYHSIRNLTFAPQVDINGNELAINDFKAEIITDDDIKIGKYATLYDDDYTLWASYRVTDAQRLSPSVMTIKCQSDIFVLDRKYMPAMMCVNESAKDIIESCFSTFDLGCTIDDDLPDVNINGYLPKQTARQRLQWVCFVMGAYVQSFFCADCNIKKIDTTTRNMAPNKVFYRPKITYKDYVTAVTATSYAYTQGTPSTTDEYVKVGGVTYIQTSQTASLTNSNVPSGTPDNIIDLSGITIVNDNNISSILTRLAAEHFNREQLSADILDSGEVVPADKIQIFDGVENVITGYVKSAQFTFGKASKAAIVLTQTTTEKAVKVVLSYVWSGVTIETQTFRFPKNTDFVLENEYVDKTEAAMRRVYLPLTQTTTGNTGNREVTNKTVNCDVALEFEDNILQILSVDGASMSREVVSIA